MRHSFQAQEEGSFLYERHMYDLTLILQAFGAKIRANRKAKRLSQTALARAAGLHRTYIADLERGARNVSMGSIVKIAEALDLSISDLCRDIDHPVLIGRHSL